MTAVLLAAGLSTRMGEPKALLPWGDGTLLDYQVNEPQAAGVAETIVVLGAYAEQIQSTLPKSEHIRAIFNRDFASGKTSSIKAGIRAADPQAEHFLIIGVDQPRPRTVLQAVIRHHIDSGAHITIPIFMGKRGHPLIFRADLRDELLAIHEETLGLREIILRRAKEVRVLEVDSPTVLVDLNTPQQYAEARQSFRA